MNRIRGIVMLLAAALAFWKGWQLHRGETAVLAYGLGALALIVGIWHLTRPDPRPVRAAANGSTSGNLPRKNGL